MNIRVKYHNGSYDIVRGFILDVLFRENKINSFYRYSENRWVTVGVDKIRLNPEPDYDGNKRRASDKVSAKSNLFMPQKSPIVFA